LKKKKKKKNSAASFQGIDAMDTSGETHIDIVHNIYKRRLDLDGKPIEDPQREQGLGETKKILNATKTASSEQVSNVSIGLYYCLPIC
jgi:hypothetical protein